MFYQVFIAVEVDGVGDKGSVDTTTVDVQTLLEVFLGALQTWHYFPHILSTKISRVSASTLKQFYCVCYPSLSLIPSYYRYANQ